MHDLTSHLVLADQYQVSDLPDDHNYDHVVTLGYYRNRPEHSTTGDAYVFPDGKHDYNVFKNAIDDMRNAINNDERVLVHCQACSSRSPAAAATIIALERNITLIDAMNVVTKHNPKTDPTDELIASAARYVAEHR